MAIRLNKSFAAGMLMRINMATLLKTKYAVTRQKPLYKKLLPNAAADWNMHDPNISMFNTTM